MKKLFFFFALICSLTASAGYNYHWAVEQKYTTRSSINQINYLNELIAGMKADGDWQKLDAFYIFALEVEQQAAWNLISPSANTCTVVNSPTFTAKQGYAGNGTTSYINSGFNPSLGVKFLQNSASAFVYKRTTSTVSGNELAETDDVNANGVQIALGATATVTPVARINVPSTGNITGASGSPLGTFVIVRTASTSEEFFGNGVSLGTNATASVARHNINVGILCRRRSTTNVNFTDAQVSFAGFGSGTVSASNIHTRLNNYLTRLGTNAV